MKGVMVVLEEEENVNRSEDETNLIKTIKNLS